MNAVKFGVFAVAAGLAAIAGAADLPEGYQPCAYVESKGATLTLSNCTSTRNMVTQMTAVFTKYAGGWFWSANGSTNYRFFIYSGSYYFDINGEGSSRTNGGSIGSTSTVNEIEIGNHYIWNLATDKLICGTKGANKAIWGEGTAMRLFASGDYGRIFSLKVFDEDPSTGARELKHDYVPCYEAREDGLTGLYDLVDQQFFGATGLTHNTEPLPRDFLLTVGDSGEVPDAPAQVGASTQVTLTAVPRAGYKVNRWHFSGEAITVPAANLNCNSVTIQIGDSYKPIRASVSFMPDSPDGNVIHNASFEEDNTLTSTYGTASSRMWTVGTMYGKAGSPFFSGNPPDGTYAATIQSLNYNVPSHKQTFVAPPGTYRLSVLAAARGGYSGQVFTALIDGVEVLNEKTTDTKFHEIANSVTLPPTEGDLHIVQFFGSSSGDAATSFDLVKLTAEATPSNTLVIAATDALSGTPEPALGFSHNYAEGDVVVCSNKGENTDEEGMVHKVVGWKLYRWDDANQTWTFDAEDPAAAGTGNETSFVFGKTSMKLEWQVQIRSGQDQLPIVDEARLVRIGAKYADFSAFIRHAGATAGSDIAESCDLVVKVRESGADAWGDEVVLGSGSMGEALAGTLKGLAPDTVYDYELFVRNSYGQVTVAASGSLTTAEEQGAKVVFRRVYVEGGFLPASAVTTENGPLLSIDGSVSSYWENGDSTVTGTPMYYDFGTTRTISRVRVYPRSDNDTVIGRVTNMKLWTSADGKDFGAEPFYAHASRMTGSAFNVLPTGSFATRVVKLTNIPYNNICEFELWSCDPMVDADPAQAMTSTSGTASPDNPDGVRLSGRVRYAPNGLLDVVCFVSREDCGDDFAAWQRAADVVRLEQKGVADGADFSFVVPDLKPKFRYYSRFFAVDGKTVTASQATRPFSLGAEVVKPVMYVTVDSAKNRYNGSTGDGNDSGGIAIIDLSTFKGANTHLDSVRFWRQSNNNTYAMFCRLRALRMALSWDDPVAFDAVEEPILNKDGFVVKKLNTEPAINWTDWKDNSDTFSAADLFMSYLDEDLIKDGGRGRGKPRYLKIYNSTSFSFSEVEFRAQKDVVKGFCLIVK